MTAAKNENASREDEKVKKNEMNNFQFSLMFNAANT